MLRGPFSAIYGNASGGVIQAFTESGAPQPTLTARLLAGDFQACRDEIKMAGESSCVNYVGDWSRFRSDGYRDHSLVARDHGNWKLRYRSSDRSNVTIVANYLRQPDTQDPLGLTRSQ
jgi:iron complex outermembrane recepter protein